ncbi:hypothetical protein HDK64DRAFT_74788 [Phyllosticta capitalensis]
MPMTAVVFPFAIFRYFFGALWESFTAHGSIISRHEFFPQFCLPFLLLSEVSLSSLLPEDLPLFPAACLGINDSEPNPRANPPLLFPNSLFLRPPLLCCPPHQSVHRTATMSFCNGSTPAGTTSNGTTACMQLQETRPHTQRV